VAPNTRWRSWCASGAMTRSGCARGASAGLLPTGVARCAARCRSWPQGKWSGRSRTTRRWGSRPRRGRAAATASCLATASSFTWAIERGSIPRPTPSAATCTSATPMPSTPNGRRLGVAGELVAPFDTDYGLREGSHVDPDGNVIRFGSPITVPSDADGGQSLISADDPVAAAATSAVQAGDHDVLRRLLGEHPSTSPDHPSPRRRRRADRASSATPERTSCSVIGRPERRGSRRRWQRSPPRRRRSHGPAGPRPAGRRR
jgi:hypothetical protein